MERMTSEEHAKAPNILVVDDTPANLLLLAEMLKRHGYRVRPVPSGTLAIQAVQKEKPDLILLDINMPGMNGYEVCERFKEDEALKEIPVLFISALDETIDKIRAFAAGGVDYITKPFQFEEVEARVHTHLTLRHLQLELESRNRQLQENYDQLKKLEDLQDSLTHMIVHDMRSPLLGISGNLEYVIPHCDALPVNDQESLKDAMTSARQLIDMVSSLLDVSRLEAGQMPIKYAPCDLRNAAQEAVRTLSGLFQQHPVTIEALPPRCEAVCDVSLIHRVLMNLLGNAAKFSPPGNPIWVKFESLPNSLKVLVCDRGQGIPAESYSRIFEKFGQVESQRLQQEHSTGLGLTFCKLAVEAHGGRIGVESALGQGSIFWFTLPLEMTDRTSIIPNSR